MNDRRLLACSKLIKGRKAVDVGTDHGYLAAYLITENICESCVACDVNEKPLACATETVSKLGLQDQISIVLSDGLDNICPDGVTDVIMAGMGGELISALLEKADWLKKNRVNLVLQTMTKPEVLRKWLYDNNFQVEREIACEDGRFVYSVMQAVYSDKGLDYPCDDIYLHGGRVDVSDEYGVKYLNKQADRAQTAGEGMLKSDYKKLQGEQMIETAKKLRDIAKG